MDVGPKPLNFLPLPVQIPIRHRNAEEHWVAPIAQGLIVENAPPLRWIRHGEQAVGHAPLDSVVEAWFMLLRLVELGWISAVDLAAHWGLHRNTLGHWPWRDQHFRRDGLVPGRLPAHAEHLRQILRVARAVVERRGRRVSAAEIGREIEAAGLGPVPRSTLAHLRLILLQPRQLSPWDSQESPDAAAPGGAAAGATPAAAAPAPAATSAEAPGAREGGEPDPARRWPRRMGARAPRRRRAPGRTAMPAVLRWRAAAERSRPRPRQETCACSMPAWPSSCARPRTCWSPWRAVRPRRMDRCLVERLGLPRRSYFRRRKAALGKIPFGS
jgi:hypothetical protein